jgi:orotidine-5'-phosphate decarboxylase
MIAQVRDMGLLAVTPGVRIPQSKGGSDDGDSMGQVWRDPTESATTTTVKPDLYVVGRGILDASNIVAATKYYWSSLQ